MINRKKSGERIIISGTTCAGKETVVKELLKRNENLKVSISYTTRAKRDGEIDGEDYFFVQTDEFENMIANGEFLEYAKVQYDKYYGTSKTQVKKMLDDGYDVILEIDVQGAQQIKEMFPQTILIFIMAPSMSEVKRRIKARGKETKEQIIERFTVAYREINEISKYNYVVVNDNLDDTVSKVEAILISEKCRVDRIEEISVENQEEIIHEFLIDKDFNNEPLKIED